MGILSKIKSVAKPSNLAKIAIASTGVGAISMGISALAAKKVENTEYTISNWGPLESDPSKLSIKYSPALSLATSDKLTISGTPFDGEYTDLDYRTRNEVYIKTSKPIKASGTGGKFRVKTSMAARAKGGASATKAGVRTGAKKTGEAVKKVTSVAGNWVWDKFKWPIIIVICLIALFALSKAVEMYSAVKAV